MKTNSGSRKVLAIVLSIAIVFSSGGGFIQNYAFAEDDGSNFVIEINGESTAPSDNCQVEYGTPIELTLPEGTSDTKFFYMEKNAGEDPQLFDATQMNLEPGEYYLTYQTQYDNQSVMGQIGTSQIKVVKGKLAAPTGLRWDGSKLRWNGVSQNQKGGTINGALDHYLVRIYKDGAATPIEEYTAGKNITSYENFVNHVYSDNKYKNGEYSFNVTAISGDKNHYEDSRTSDISGNLPIVRVQVAAGAGVSAVTPNVSPILIPGDEDHNSNVVTATLKAGYIFKEWTGEGVTFAENKSETTVRLNDSYNGPTTLTVTAIGKDNKAPTVTNPIFVEKGKIKASATDNEEGVAFTAFSTAAEESGVNHWSPVETVAPGNHEFTHTLTAGGDYYFYAKDKDGNVTRSANAIKVTSVDYNDFYENNVKINDKKDFFIGNQILDLAAPGRIGWTFGGWFDNQDFNGNALPSIDVHKEGGYALYGKWQRELFGNITLADVNETYRGQEGFVLRPNLEDGLLEKLTGNITYKWEKEIGENQFEQVGTDPTYKVKDVADSGKYRVTLTNTDGEGTVVDSKASNIATVTINKAPLDIVGKTKTGITTITYGDEAPKYDFGFGDNKLCDGDTKEEITVGTVGCEYVKGNDVGQYPITVEGFLAKNYEINHIAGILNVNPLGGTVAARLSDEDQKFVYDTSEHRPEVKVTLNGDLLDPANYNVDYSNNIYAGQATATVTLKGNYTGSDNVDFTIGKGTYEAEVVIPKEGDKTKDGWTYGNDRPEIEISRYEAERDAITFLYAAKGSEEYSETPPKKAGEYKVKAIIPETLNYNQVTTPAKNFTIFKRDITITSESEEFTYDGQEHSNSHYSVNGAFANGEGFVSVTVTGKVLNVTTDLEENNNTINYVLNSATDENNYNIIKDQGTLKVLPQKLNTPYGINWDSKAPGKVSWVKIARTNLDVNYKLWLYAYDGTEYINIPVAGNEFVTTTKGFYDFADEIRNFAWQGAEEGKTYSYHFKSQVVPVGGSGQANYLDSDISDYSKPLYTALVQARKLGEDWGIGAININGHDAVILLDGEKATVTANTASGYVFKTDNPWQLSSNLDLLKSSVDFDNGEATAQISPDLQQSVLGEYVKAVADDDIPKIDFFTAQNSEDLKRVKLMFSAQDLIGITGWAITTSDEDPAEDSDAWNLVLPGAHVNFDTDVEEAGNYYLYVKDVAGNIVKSQEPIHVYMISFDKGHETATGNMEPILKADNTTITLPENQFSREGHVFQNWSGASGRYGDNGSYRGQTNETLTALWADGQYDYKINYYYMDVNGQYKAAPDKTVTFSALYNTAINSSDESIQLPKEGFTYDATRESSIAVAATEESNLNVYYQRNKYNLTYKYTKPGESETVNSEAIYYGASLAEAFAEDTKPVAAGYNFIGWSFGNAGAQPETMPTHDVLATGTFENKKGTYHIRYFIQNLNGEGTEVTDTFGSYDAKNLDVKGTCNTTVTYDETTVGEIKGFTFKGISASYGDPQTGRAYPEDGESTLTASITDDANPLFINVYYSRNIYDATLNVWKSKVGLGSPMYSHEWKVAYGAIIPENMDVYDQDNWGNTDEDYELAKYVGWSTGEEPTLMPAGNITVTRQYVKKTLGTYNIEVYTETANEGVYAKNVFPYHGNTGEVITLGKGEEYKVDYSTFVHRITDFDYYEYVSKPDEEVLQAQVTNTDEGEEPAVLKIYFDRKMVETKILYYYNDGSDEEHHLMATATKMRRWGSTYDYEPLALFDSSTGGNWVDGGNILTMEDITFDGEKPDEYDFKTNNYVASFGGYYQLGDVEKWPSRNFDTVESLTQNPEKNRGPVGVKNSMRVYYTKIDPDKQFVMEIGYNAKTSPGLKFGKAGFVNLTQEYNGQDYKVYLGNEAYFYDNGSYVSSNIEEYPGLGMYNLGNGTPEAPGKYVYTKNDDNLKEGYSRVEIGDREYYIDENLKRIYIPITNNNMYSGHRFGYTYPVEDKGTTKAEIGSDGVIAFLEECKGTHADDEAAKGAHVYNSTYGSSIDFGTDDKRLTISFEDGKVYTVTYTVGGQTYEVETTEGGGYLPIDSFPKREGYQLNWYTDPELTNQVDLSEIDKSTTVYGRYEKKILKHNIYAYYELADYAENGGNAYQYITEGDLNSFPEGDITFQDTVHYADVLDEYGRNVTVELVKRTYYYKGQVALVKDQAPGLSFAGIDIEAGPYAMDGINYDASNGGNILKGYSQDEEITFKLHFIRDKYQLTVDPNMPHSNVTTDEYRIGQTIEIEPLTREGYDFGGWKWQEKAEGEETYKDWTVGPPETTVDDTVSFAMPSRNVKAEATWNPTTYNQVIMHYFQNTDKQYSTAEVALMQQQEGRAASIVYDNKQYVGTVFGHTDSPSGVSFEVGGATYYSATPEFKDGNYIVEPEDLSAIKESVETLQESSTDVSDFAKDITHYKFIKTIYKHETDIRELKEGDFTNFIGTQLDYYYGLDSFVITAESVCVGDTDTKTTILGADTYYYGSEVKLAASWNKGHALVGWFKKADLPQVIGSIEDLPTPLTTEANYIFEAKQSGSYTAVLVHIEAEAPDCQVAGKTDLVYGYEPSKDNVVTVKATFKEGTLASNYIKSYQWYLNNEKVQGATGATYSIPQGWTVGEYNLTCEVVAENRDNGSTAKTTTLPHTVTVSKTGMIVEASDHTDTYDGTDNHQIQVSVAAPLDDEDYTIYYGHEELTKENYQQKGSVQNKRFKDVLVDGEGNVIPYTVYYYVKSNNENYEDVAGSKSVTINPVILTVSLGNGVYSKVYDGQKEITGSVFEEGTQLYKLTHDDDLYDVTGIVAADENKGYVLSCDASFNDSHVKDANAVIMTDLELVDGEGNALPNYRFEEGYSVHLSAYIDRLDLGVQWSSPELVYDGQEQCPEANFTVEIPDVDKNNITKVVSGKQTNAGTYNATVKIVAASGSQITDFTLGEAVKEYTINPRPIKVSFEDEAFTYDNKPHTLRTAKVLEGELAEGHDLSITANGKKTNPGNYSIGANGEDIKITYAGQDMLANYAVTMEPGNLSIGVRTVTVTGITALNKDYDGNAEAKVDISNISFANFAQGDVLGLDMSKITAQFEDSTAGQGKHVAITIAPDALTGAKAAYYRLDVNGSQQETTANINKLEIRVGAENKTVTYGENVEFTALLTGFIEGENSGNVAIANIDNISYTVGKNLASAKAYDAKLGYDAAGYTIFPNVSMLSADNYTFAMDTGSLTVEKRKVSVEAAADTEPITKVYDGNNVVTAAIADTYYNFTQVDGLAETGLVNGDHIGLKYDKAYESKNVGEPKVNLTNLAIDNNNYTLVSAAGIDLPGTITKKHLTVTANSKSIKYGQYDEEGKDKDGKTLGYTASYSGFVSGENDKTPGQFIGQLEFSCDYDSTQADKRNVKAGGYTITPSGLESDNYEIEYKTGVLTVNKASITIKATSTFDNPRYGGTDIPTFGFEPKGLMYEEVFEDVAIKNPLCDVTYTDSWVKTKAEILPAGGSETILTTIPGTYTVTPIIAQNGTPVYTAQNYNFITDNTPVVVTKSYLSIDGIGAKDKVYDGTTNVEEFNLTQLHYDGLLSEDRAYLANNPQVKPFDFVNPHYDQKDVLWESEEVQPIRVAWDSIKLNNYLATRYVLQTSQTETTAKIMPRPLLITADDKRVPYGMAAPEYTVTYSKIKVGDTTVEKSGLVTGELANASHVTIACDYSNAEGTGTPVNVYENYIIPSNFVGSATAKASNYDPEYRGGQLEVYEHQLHIPTSDWDENTPGKITWNEVDPIGDVEVAGYNLQLKKGNAAIGEPIYVPATAPLSHIYTEVIRSNGAGDYTVAVQAVASETNNSGKMNVQDSEYGTGEHLYAAKAIFQFATDETTTAGKGSSISVKGQEDGYVILPGESGVPIKATFRNATGYTVKKVAVSNNKLTVSGDTVDGVNYDAKVKLGADNTSVANIIITLSLDARPATLSTTINGTPFADGMIQTTYGYSDGGNPATPNLTVNVGVVNDNVTTSDYTYKYAWAFKKGYEQPQTYGEVTKDGVATDEWKFPVGQKASKQNDFYKVRCIVTATRKDNGQTITLANTWDLSNDHVINVKINQAKFTAKTKIEGWTYGDTPNNPELYDLSTTVEEHPSIATPKYEYEISPNNWVETRPSDVGTYKVRATIKESTNYKSFATDLFEFKIGKAKLATPDNLTMGASGTASYGTISWDKVDGPKRDGNGSAIGVSYEINLYKQGEDDPIKTYTTDELSYNITSDIQDFAEYYYTVKAVVSNLSDRKNCDDSDMATSQITTIGAGITAEGNGALNGNKYTMTYDDTDVTLTASLQGAQEATAYQWYKDGVAVDNATDSIYKLSHVADSGNYTCKIQVAGDEVYTPIVELNITKRPVVFLGDSGEKVYDGKEEIINSFKIGEIKDGVFEEATSETSISGGIVYGHTNNVTYELKGKNVATYDGTITAVNGVVIRDGEDNVTDDYDIKTQVGQLVITPRDITAGAAEFAIAPVDNVVYKGAAYTPEPTVTDTGLADGIGNKELVKGTAFEYSYADNVDAGTATITVTGKGNYSGSKTVTFTINKRPVAFVGNSQSKEYNGSQQKITTLKSGEMKDGQLVVGQTQAGGLVSGHSHNVTYLAQGTEAGTYDGVITDKNQVVIKAGGTDVTSNYDIITKIGKLTIDKTDADWQIGLANDEHTYSGQPWHNTKVATTTALTGITTFKYSFDENGEYVDALANLEKTNANEEGYMIYVKATNPNYSREVKTTAKLIIKKKELTVNTNGGTKVYDATPLTAPGTVTGFVNEETYQFTVTGSQTDYGQSENAYDLVFGNGSNGYTANKNNYKITENLGELSVSKKPVKVSVVGNSHSDIYDGKEHVISGYTWTTNELEDQKLYKEEDFTFPKNGGASAKRTDKGKTNMGLDISQFTNINNNFDATFEVEDGYQTVTPRDITAGAAAFAIAPVDNVVYKGAAYTPEPTVTDTGLADGVGNKELVKGTDFEYSYADNVDAGTATITVTGKGNYSGSKTVTFTINKRPVAFVGDSQSKEYNGSQQKITTLKSGEMKDGQLVVGQTQAGGLVSGHSHNVTYLAQGTEAGTYDGVITDKNQVVIKAGSADVTSNYDITTKIGKLTIDKTSQPFTISLSDDSKVYNGLEQYSAKTSTSYAAHGTTTYQYAFEQGGPYVNNLTQLKKKDVGVYTVYVKATNPNHLYAATCEAKLEITKAPLEVTTPSGQKTYDGTALKKSGGSVIGLVNGEKATVDCIGSQTNAGTSKNKYELLFDTGVKPTNYEVKKETLGDLTVDKRNLVITGKEYTAPYTGSFITLEGTTVNAGENVGLAPGHTHNAKYKAEGREISTYQGTITPAEDVKVFDAANNEVTLNYNIVTNLGYLTIQQASLDWSIDLESATYTYSGSSYCNNNAPTTDAKSGTTTYEYSFAVDGPYTSDLSSLTKTDAGEYSIYVKATNPNYTHAATCQSVLIIKPVELSVTTGSDAKVYDGAPLKKAECQVTGFINGETGGITCTGSQVDAGTSNNTYSLIFSEEDNTYTAKRRNYIVKAANEHLGTLAVSSRNVTFTSKKAIEEYTGSPITIGGTEVDNLVLGHTHNVTFSATAVDVGTYEGLVTPKSQVRIFNGLSDVTANYNITVIPGELKIEKSNEDWTISLDEYVCTYNKKPQYNRNAAQGIGHDGNPVRGTTEYMYSFDELGDYTGDLSNLTKVDANETDYIIYVKATNSNYTKESTTTSMLKIQKAKATIVVNDANKVYKQPDPKFTGTIIGLFGDDQIENVEYSRIGAQDANNQEIGTYYDVLTATYAEADNYVVEVRNGDFTIINVPQKEEPNPINTGDDNLPILWMILFGISGTGTMLLSRRRKEENQ